MRKRYFRGAKGDIVSAAVLTSHHVERLPCHGLEHSDDVAGIHVGLVLGPLFRSQGALSEAKRQLARSSLTLTMGKPIFSGRPRPVVRLGDAFPRGSYRPIVIRRLTGREFALLQLCTFNVNGEPTP